MEKAFDAFPWPLIASAAVTIEELTDEIETLRRELARCDDGVSAVARIRGVRIPPRRDRVAVTTDKERVK